MPDTSIDFTSRYYLIESVQQILTVFGDDCVVSGMNVINLSIDVNNIIRFELTAGKIICDRTLIEFPSSSILELDVTDIPDSSVLALTVCFRYLRTSRPNMSIITLKIIDDDGNCDNWFKEVDKLILTIIRFDKINNSVGLIESDFFKKFNISINNNMYQIRPYNYTIEQLRPILKSMNDRLMEIN